MLRSILRLQCPLQSALTIYKQYGTKVQARVEMTDSARESAITKLDSFKKSNKYGTRVVYTRQTYHDLHFNVEELSGKLQTVFVEKLLKQMKEIVNENETRRISFNFIKESVFRYQLNMPVRKLGFKSYFKRYNSDKGLAVFIKKSGQSVKMYNSNMGSYNRMAYIKRHHSNF